MTENSNEGWLAPVLERHRRLAPMIAALTENMLRTSKIDYLSTNSRTKTLEGALEKIERKEYQDPQSQLTDLTGIRIVTYFERDVGSPLS